MKSEKWIQQEISRLQIEYEKEGQPPFLYNVISAKINLLREILDQTPGVLDDDKDKPPISVELPRPLENVVQIKNFIIYPSGTISYHTQMFDEDSLIAGQGISTFRLNEELVKEFGARYERD